MATNQMRSTRTFSHLGSLKPIPNCFPYASYCIIHVSSFTSPTNLTTSLLTYATVIYSTSVVDIATRDWILDFQQTRSHLNRFDMVITPHHDYYPLTPEGQKQVPKFLRRWITPREPPDSHVVCVMCSILCDCIRFYCTGDNVVLVWWVEKF